MSWIELIPTLSRFSLVKALIAIGTVCRFCSRFSAVTTMSVTVVADELVSVAAACAVAAWLTPPNMLSALAAHDSIRIRFFISPPWPDTLLKVGAPYFLIGGRAPELRLTKRNLTGDNGAVNCLDCQRVTIDA